MAKKPDVPRPPGRPTKCTPETTDKVLVAVRKGHYVETACRLAKIADPTFYAWKQRGEAGEEPFATFLNALKEAESEAQDAYLDTIRVGGTGPNSVHWVSAMTFMERRWPHLYGKRDPQRAELADLEKTNKRLENEVLEAKLVAIKRGYNPDDRTINIIVPTIDEMEHTPETKE